MATDGPSHDDHPRHVLTPGCPACEASVGDVSQDDPDEEPEWRERPREEDFYFDKANGVWVYKWADDRWVLRDDNPSTGDA